MFKRLLLIGLLCVGLIALVNNEATARCRVVNGKLVCTDICAVTFLQGVGNPDQNAVAACGALYIEAVEGRCWNKGDNSAPAQGVVFFPDITVSEQSMVLAYMVTDERGSATVENICWDWQSEIYQPILDYAAQYPSEVCPNRNWYLDPNPASMKIKIMYVYHSAYQVDNKGNPYLSSALCRRCDYSPDGTECESNPFNCKTVATSQCQDRELNFACTDAIIECFPSCFPE